MYVQLISNINTKLTLKLDNSIIEHAKIYANEKNTSLSKLIESYLDLLVETKHTQEVTPLVKSISSIVDLPKNYDHKKQYRKNILNKYTK